MVSEIKLLTNSNSDVTTVLVKFANEQVGVKACQSSQYRSVYPGFVPVSKVEVVFLAKGNVMLKLHDYSFLSHCHGQLPCTKYKD